MLTKPPVPYALVGAFSVIAQPVVEPMEHYTAQILHLLDQACPGVLTIVKCPPCVPHLSHRAII